MTIDVSDWSEVPAENTDVGGVNIGEDCPAGNVNNALRTIMAGVKTLSLTIASAASYMLKSGGVFTGAISRSGAGGYCYDVDATLTSGRRYWLVEGTSLPASPQEGDEVTFYAA